MFHYPGNYKRNIILKNLNKIKLEKSDYIFHAGTKIKDNKIVSSGGRVLNFSSSGNSFQKIRKKIIKLLKKLNWKSGFFRKDIGWKVIKNENN